MFRSPAATYTTFGFATTVVNQKLKVSGLWSCSSTCSSQISGTAALQLPHKLTDCNLPNDTADLKTVNGENLDVPFLSWTKQHEHEHKTWKKIDVWSVVDPRVRGKEKCAKSHVFEARPHCPVTVGVQCYMLSACLLLLACPSPYPSSQ